MFLYSLFFNKKISWYPGIFARETDLVIIHLMSSIITETPNQVRIFIETGKYIFIPLALRSRPRKKVSFPPSSTNK